MNNIILNREKWHIPSMDIPLWLGKKHDFCVVIPVINEGDRIKALLGRMLSLDISRSADIIIIDGGSTDDSLQIDSLKKANVRGLLLKTGPGKLSAQLRCAYAFTLEHGYEGIITIDGNNKDDPEAIPRFIQALKQEVDFVQASRFIPGGVAENTPKFRDFAIRYIHVPCLSFASGFKWTDTTQGFRAYSRRLLLDPRVAPFREIFITYELLAYLSYRAPKLGYKCLEIPTIRRYPMSEVPTKISSLNGNLSILKIMINTCFGLYNPILEKMKPNNSKEYSIFRSQKSIKSTVFIFTVSFVILVSSFQFNIFGIMHGKSVYENTRDTFSEALVIARIVETHKSGYLSNSGLLGKYGEFDKESHWIGRQYNIFLGERYQLPFQVYTSNAGMQGFIYGFIDSAMIVLGVDSGYKRLFFHKLINSSLLALVLSLFVIFSFKYLGYGAAITSIITTSLSHWLSGFSVNLYWMLFLAFLPFMITIMFLMKYPVPNNKNIKILCAFLFFSVLLKSLAGYEYMSTILIAMVIPFLFFTILERWSYPFLLKRVAIVSVTAIAGFITAITLHVLQLSHQLGGIGNAISLITKRVKVRTLGDLDYAEIAHMNQEKNNIVDIIYTYLNGTVFNFNDLIGLNGNITFWMIIVLLLFFSLIGHSMVKSHFISLDRLNRAMLAVTWLSILAPISWFSLAKRHSFVHTHLNHILWYVPFLLLVFAYIGFILELLFRKIEYELYTYGLSDK